MKSTNATSLRKELFGAIEKAVHSIPTRIRSRKGDAIILSYRQYLSLKGQKNKTHSTGLRPLVQGKVVKPLNERTEEELLRYMGLYMVLQ